MLDWGFLKAGDTFSFFNSDGKIELNYGITEIIFDQVGEILILPLITFSGISLS